jgi:hypothetical protein
MENHSIASVDIMVVHTCNSSTRKMEAGQSKPGLHSQTLSQKIKKINFFVVLRFELRAIPLSHSTSPFLCCFFFEIGSRELFVKLALNLDPPDLCLLSS